MRPDHGTPIEALHRPAAPRPHAFGNSGGGARRLRHRSRIDRDPLGRQRDMGFVIIDARRHRQASEAPLPASAMTVGTRNPVSPWATVSR